MKGTTRLLFFGSLFVFSLNLQGQQIKNPDSLFHVSRNYAEAENYKAAIIELKKLISEFPENNDYQIYLGRVYFWNSDYEKARNQLNNFLNQEPPNAEALDVLIQVALASKDAEAVLENSEIGIENFPQEKDKYLFNKVLALEQLGRENEALEIIKSISEDAENHNDAEYIKARLLKKQKNMIATGYLYTQIEDADPWHLGHLEYTRKSEFIPFTVRLNYGHVFGEKALQGEVDLYPKISENSYLYLNAGFSNESPVFPELRLSGEYFYNFSIFNTSLGLRYLNFTAAEVTMFTGSAAANFGEYQVGYRVFLVSEENEWFPSHNIHLKKSFLNRESHIQLDLQYGRIPYFYVITDQLSQVNSYRAGVNIRYRLIDNFFIQPILMYEREEFAPERFRNRLNAKLILSKRF